MPNECKSRNVFSVKGQPICRRKAMIADLSDRAFRAVSPILMTVVRKEILMGGLLSGGRSCWSGDGWCSVMSLGD